MLDTAKVDEIVSESARAFLAPPDLERVMTEPSTDSEGKEALRITLVIRPEAVHALSGDTAVDLLVHIQQELSSAGEDRLPIISYATEQELQDEANEIDTGEDDGAL